MKRTSHVLLLLATLTCPLFASLEVVYHLATLNAWKEVVEEQLEALERSGLADACNRLTVTVAGPHFEEADLLLRRFSFYPKVRLVHASKDVRVSEFPGIEAVKQIALEHEDANILYMHSKGITHLQSDRSKNVRAWRRYLEYFLIERWQDCVEALKTFNLCGVEWLNCTKSQLPQIEHPGIFAGNFWWARATYLRTCQDTPQHPWEPEELYRNRYYCETFIASGTNPMPKTFHQSGVNLYEFNYAPEYYKPKPLQEENAIEIVYLAASGRIPCMKEQLRLMETSGLAEACDRMTVIVLGPDKKAVEELIANSSLSSKASLIHASNRYHPGEFPAFEMIKRIARTNPKAKICYFHNWGKDYPKAPPRLYKSIWHAIHQTLIGKRKELTAWLKNLFHPKELASDRVIREWRRCVDALDLADLSGPTWKKGIPRKAHFPDIVCSGYFEENCWWARADYINSCHDVHFRSPYHVYREHWTPAWCKQNCVDCRMFVGTGENPKIEML